MFDLQISNLTSYASKYSYFHYYLSHSVVWKFLNTCIHLHFMKHYFYQTRLIIILFDIWIEFIRLWDSVKSFQVFELILLGSIARTFSTIQHIISDSAAQKFSIFYSNFIRIYCMEIRTYSNRFYQIWLVGNVHSKCSSNFGDSSFYKTTKYSKRF